LYALPIFVFSSRQRGTNTSPLEESQSNSTDSTASMASIVHPLLTLLASLTRQELAQQIAYLKAENKMLRSKLPKRIDLSVQEKRTLIKHGKKLGARIKELITIDIWCGGKLKTIYLLFFMEVAT
jgi:hypothetical protein